MKQTIENKTLIETNVAVTENAETRKPYVKPELTHYGGISSLVLGVPTAGADGAPPFAAIS